MYIVTPDLFAGVAFYPPKYFILYRFVINSLTFALVFSNFFV